MQHTTTDHPPKDCSTGDEMNFAEIVAYAAQQQVPYDWSEWLAADRRKKAHNRVGVPLDVYKNIRWMFIFNVPNKRMTDSKDVELTYEHRTKLPGKPAEYSLVSWAAAHSWAQEEAKRLGATLITVLP